MHRLPLPTIALAAVLGAAGCGPKPLPEQGTRVEQLYVQRCGGCHQPYRPASLTPAMWQIQIDAMQSKMAQAGVAPLNDAERRTITDYLVRNAGHE